MTRRISVLLALVLGFFIMRDDVAVAATFNAETFTLDNGMHVVVVPNRRVPAVAHMVWYRTGASDEERGKSGLAHFLEHLMFKGTKKFSADDFSKTVARLGGHDNAFTSQDYTAYYQVVPRPGLEQVMEMEADRMTHLQLEDEKTVFSERDVILEERRQRVENDPAAILEEEVFAALFRNHPYGVPIIGWEEEIAALGPEDALQFYRRHYTPDNAILVVSGDIDAEELRPLAERYYGKIKARGVVPRPITPEPPRRTAQRIVHESAQVRREQWQRLWLLERCSSLSQNGAKNGAKNGTANGTTSGATNGKTESRQDCAEAFEILAKDWGGGATSFLYRHLVVEEKLASAVHADYDDLRDYAIFSIDAVPAADVSLERLEAAIEKFLGEWKGIEPATLARSQRQLIASATYARDGLLGPAYIMGARLSAGDSVQDVEEWVDRVQAVTTDQVNQAAMGLLQNHAPLTALLRRSEPPQAETPQGKNKQSEPPQAENPLGEPPQSENQQGKNS